MTKTTSQIISDLYHEMLMANQKAEAASYEYNRLSNAINEEETKQGNSRNLHKATIAERIRARKEKDNELIGYFKTYTFNQGEVVRLSAILQGIAAYKKLNNYSPLARGPVINIDGVPT